MSLEVYEIEQFILVQILDKIIQFHQANDKNSYENIITVNGDKPELTYNRILSCPPDVYKFFNELTDLQKSCMVPKIVLYKKEKDGTEKVIKFRNFFDSQEYSKFATTATSFDINQRKEDGVGLKRISISDRSERPSDVHITCKIDLYFDNITSMMNSDVISLVTTPEIRTNNSAIDYRIKLVFGWETPADSSGNIFSSDQIDIIERSNVVYLLELVSHDLDFKENGSVGLSIEYQGALERYFGANSEADIFNIYTDLYSLDLKYPDEKFIDIKDPAILNSVRQARGNVGRDSKLDQYIKISALRDSIEFQIQQLNEKNKKDLDGQETSLIPNSEQKKDDRIEELEKQESELSKQIEDLEVFAVKEKYSKILNGIFSSNRLFYIDVPSEFLNGAFKASAESDRATFDVNLFNVINLLKGPNTVTTDRGSLEFLRTKINEKLNDAKSIKDLESVTLKSNVNPFVAIPGMIHQILFPGDEVKDKIVHYITLGDIVNTVVGFLPKKENINLILGPCKIGKYTLNLSQFPISVVNFSIWFVNNVVKKCKKKYFLWDFVQDLIRDLVTPNLVRGRISGDTKEIALTVAVSSVVSDQKLSPGIVYNDNILVNYLSRNITNVSKLYPYLILYAYDFELTKRNGDAKEDEADGIYHYAIGRNKGIVKSIHFNKVDFPKYRDMRMTHANINNPGNILRIHYNLSIKTIGNPLFMNGGTFYFDGSYLGLMGAEITDRIGLGGYYIVTGIEINGSPDIGYEVVVSGTWMAMKTFVDINGVPVKSDTIEGRLGSIPS